MYKVECAVCCVWSSEPQRRYASQIQTRLNDARQPREQITLTADAECNPLTQIWEAVGVCKEIWGVLSKAQASKAPTADGGERQILALGLLFWRTAHQMEANTSGVRLTVRVDLIMPTSRLRLGWSSSFFFMLKLIRFIFMPFGVDQRTIYLLFGINMSYMVYRARWEACKIVNPLFACRILCIKWSFAVC